MKLVPNRQRRRDLLRGTAYPINKDEEIFQRFFQEILGDDLEPGSEQARDLLSGDGDAKAFMTLFEMNMLLEEPGSPERN